MEVFVAVLVIVAATHATIPRPCDSPRQWEGKAVTLVSNSGHEQRSVISYDGLGKRMRVVDTPEPYLHERRERDMLILYQTRTLYAVDVRTGACRVRRSIAPFKSIGIPSDAAYIRREVIGLTGNTADQLPVYTYGGSRSNGQRTEYFHGTVTAYDCIPVVHTFVVRGGALMQANFYNITMGISNPNVFDIPPECMRSGK